MPYRGLDSGDGLEGVGNLHQLRRVQAVILAGILAVGKHEIGSGIRFLGCLSQSLEKRPQRRTTTVAAVYAPTPPLLPLVDACTHVTLGP